MKVHYLLVVGLLFFLPAQADIIQLAPHAKIVKSHAVPTRGMTMKRVRKLYGKPIKIHKSKGIVKHNWPRITRWEYGGYSVYFERHIVLHTVVHKKLVVNKK